MKKNYFILFIMISFVCCFTSCQHNEKYMYNSGTYMYRYYIVNNTSDTIRIIRLYEFFNENHLSDTFIAPNDTSSYHNFTAECRNNDINTLSIPSIEEGFEEKMGGSIEERIFAGEHIYKITSYDGYHIGENYEFKQGPSPLIYDFFFYIDEEFLSSLPIVK